MPADSLVKLWLTLVPQDQNIGRDSILSTYNPGWPIDSTDFSRKSSQIR